jgi:hypothetical protein
MSDPHNRSPFAPASFTSDFPLRDRLSDLLSGAVVQGRLTEGEAQMVERASTRGGRARWLAVAVEDSELRQAIENRLAAHGQSCSHCGGPMVPVGYPKDQAAECFACGRLHLAGAEPVDCTVGDDPVPQRVEGGPGLEALSPADQDLVRQLHAQAAPDLEAEAC